MKRLSVTVMLVVCLSNLLAQPSNFRKLNTPDSTKKTIFYKKVQLQASIGVAYTNLSFPSPGYGNRYLYFMHSDLFLLKKVSLLSDIRLGIAYEPVGYRNSIYLINGPYSFTRYRLFYGNLHLLYGYQLSKPTKRVETRILTGVFVGKLFDHDILSLVKPDNILYRSKAISTYGPWNAGFSLGISSSVFISSKTVLGLKLFYQVGTTNIIIPEAVERSGIKRYTRSIKLSTFLNF